MYLQMVVYQMNAKRRGTCLIIRSDQQNPLPGYDKDCKDIEHVFKQLHFVTECLLNPSKRVSFSYMLSPANNLSTFPCTDYCII